METRSGDDQSHSSSGGIRVAPIEGRSGEMAVHAARLSKEIEAWKAGHLEGRADVASIVPLLIAAQQEKAACTCATSQIPSGS